MNTNTNKQYEAKSREYFSFDKANLQGNFQGKYGMVYFLGIPGLAFSVSEKDIKRYENGSLSVGIQNGADSKDYFVSKSVKNEDGTFTKTDQKVKGPELILAIKAGKFGDSFKTNKKSEILSSIPVYSKDAVKPATVEETVTPEPATITNLLDI